MDKQNGTLPKIAFSIPKFEELIGATDVFNLGRETSVPAYFQNS